MLKMEWTQAIEKLLANPQTTEFLFTRMVVNGEKEYGIFVLSPTGWDWDWSAEQLPTKDREMCMQIRKKTEELMRKIVLKQ